jgi:hypothetical protein
MNTDLEVVEEGQGVALFYRPGEGAGRTGGKGGSVADGEWPSFNVFASGGGETMRPGRW